MQTDICMCFICLFLFHSINKGTNNGYKTIAISWIDKASTMTEIICTNVSVILIQCKCAITKKKPSSCTRGFIYISGLIIALSLFVFSSGDIS